MLSRTPTFVLIAAGTVAGLAGIDLVLPAIPSLPDTLGGNLEMAQWVLAAFAAGTGVGLLIAGELGARFGIGPLLAGSLLAYAALSLMATTASDLVALSLVRFFQGLVASTPAVFAPVMIKAMYSPTSAVAMLGRIASIESMAPALAPMLGAWMLGAFGWKSTFFLTAAVALALGAFWTFARQTRVQFGVSSRSSAGYLPLLRDRRFLRYALSQAFTLGALLIIVFAAPTMLTRALGGQISDFIIMQVLGITFFVLLANVSQAFVQRFGAAKTILSGTATTAVGCLGIAALGLLPDPPIPLVWLCFVLTNAGLGLRGPPGFFSALQAAGDNEARGSALVILFIAFTAATGTVAVAPFAEQGPLFVGALASGVALLAVVLSVEKA
ncbi:MAG: MFS transporter [Pseudomonadota bacterium]